MVLDLLSLEMIQIISDSPSWEESCQIVGKMLVDAGKVEERYVQAMLDYVHKFGPYIVIAPGIALFHARPEDGAKEMGLSLAVAEKGIVFNAGDKDPVQLIFALAAVDSDSHLTALGEIATLLQNEQAVAGLISAKDRAAALKVIVESV